MSCICVISLIQIFNLKRYFWQWKVIMNITGSSVNTSSHHSSVRGKKMEVYFHFNDKYSNLWTRPTSFHTKVVWQLYLTGNWQFHHRQRQKTISSFKHLFYFSLWIVVTFSKFQYFIPLCKIQSSYLWKISSLTNTQSKLFRLSNTCFIPLNESS